METIALTACLVMALLDGAGKWYATVDLNRRRMRLAQAKTDRDRLRGERQELETRHEKTSLKQREIQNDCRSMAQDLSQLRVEIEELQKDADRIRGGQEDDESA